MSRSAAEFLVGAAVDFARQSCGVLEGLLEELEGRYLEAREVKPDREPSIAEAVGRAAVGFARNHWLVSGLLTAGLLLSGAEKITPTYDGLTKMGEVSPKTHNEETGKDECRPGYVSKNFRPTNADARRGGNSRYSGPKWSMGQLMTACVSVPQPPNPEPGTEPNPEVPVSIPRYEALVPKVPRASIPPGLSPEVRAAALCNQVQGSLVTGIASTETDFNFQQCVDDLARGGTELPLVPENTVGSYLAPGVVDIDGGTIFYQANGGVTFFPDSQPPESIIPDDGN